MTIDTATNALMLSIENPGLTFFSKIIAYVFEPIVLLIISIMIAAYLYFKVSKKKGIFLASTIIAIGIIIKVLKAVFGRFRPINMIMQETTFSMPSGHAAITVVFFGLMAYLFTKGRNKTAVITTTTLIILLTGFTRIYLRVHWLTDVIAGFILGGFILIVSILLYKKF